MEVVHEMVRLMVVLVVGKSLRVMGGSSEVQFVGQECLPTLLALDKMEPVVKQMWVVVDHTVFDSQPEGCRDCRLMT